VRSSKSRADYLEDKGEQSHRKHQSDIRIGNETISVLSKARPVREPELLAEEVSRRKGAIRQLDEESNQ
jgi:hypothetical protein